MLASANSAQDVLPSGDVVPVAVKVTDDDLTDSAAVDAALPSFLSGVGMSKGSLLRWDRPAKAYVESAMVHLLRERSLQVT